MKRVKSNLKIPTKTLVRSSESAMTPVNGAVTTYGRLWHMKKAEQRAEKKKKKKKKKKPTRGRNEQTQHNNELEDEEEEKENSPTADVPAGIRDVGNFVQRGNVIQVVPKQGNVGCVPQQCERVCVAKQCVHAINTFEPLTLGRRSSSCFCCVFRRCC